MISLTEWYAGSQKVTLQPVGTDQAYQICYRVEGRGAWLTLFHGFPTCAWDWARLTELLKPHFTLLTFDFLGFGYSDKPKNHRYTIFEQAGFAQALWQHLGVTKTGLIAHDYGAIVAQEILHRQNTKELITELTNLIFLNNAMYPQLHRALPIQRLLSKPLLGAVLTRLLNEKSFNRNFSRIFSAKHPVSEIELKSYWQSITNQEGNLIYHRLLHYMADRQVYGTRWSEAVESTTVPLHFIWGMADPVSGRHVIDYLRTRLTSPNILELNEVGHYPQVEVPEIVAKAVLTSFKQIQSGANS